MARRRAEGRRRKAKGATWEDTPGVEVERETTTPHTRTVTGPFGKGAPRNITNNIRIQLVHNTWAPPHYAYFVSIGHRRSSVGMPYEEANAEYARRVLDPFPEGYDDDPNAIHYDYE